MKRVLLLVMIVISIIGCSFTKSTQTGINALSNQAFAHIGLRTNTKSYNVSVLDLEINSAKDKIRSINNPITQSNEQAKEWINPDTKGILIKVNHEVKFYPLFLLKKHQTINDKIHKFAYCLTYNPETSLIQVFDRNIKNKILTFGNSGVSWNNGRLIYDTNTESLWDTWTGESIVGDNTGKELNPIYFEQKTFTEVVESFEVFAVMAQTESF